MTKNNAVIFKKYRYRLHAKVREEGHRVKPREKTIYIAYDRRDDLSPSMIKLRDIFNYVIQTEIQ
jgi:hypothetical protein